jgi:hypothetical protein
VEAAESEPELWLPEVCAAGEGTEESNIPATAENKRSDSTIPDINLRPEFPRNQLTSIVANNELETPTLRPKMC